MKKKSEHFIAEAVKRPGALRKKTKTPKGEKIPAKKIKELAKKPGLTGEQARFAENVLIPASKKRKKK